MGLRAVRCGQRRPPAPQGIARCHPGDLALHLRSAPATLRDARSPGSGTTSRLGDELEIWAIFEGTEPENTTSDPIATDDQDLISALSKLDLQLDT